ncbi:TerC family protein [Clostridium thermarum]|uniref:TerC family protein n=1 Tax=Clostridium thermarum TaxID=1716543 RepID=UPI0013D6AC2D|nr:TerC family protein [Clostridium thermarum]
MEYYLTLILGILEITMLDLVLCGDNIGIIALVTKNLPKKSAKLASFIGITGAIILRIYFAACISVFLKVKWIPLRLVGGIILAKVTWDLIKSDHEDEEYHGKENKKFWDAVFSVIIADISMSLDNVLAITGAADGNMLLITFGILLNIPIIFFGSQFVVKLMKKNPMVIYIGGAILAFTSVRMIVEDALFKHYITLGNNVDKILPWNAALITLIYGYDRAKKSKSQIGNNKNKITRAS